MPTLQLAFLGRPEITLDGVAVQLERRKSLALLAYLAAEPGQHGREQLAALLWPEAERGRANLRRALWTLEEALGGHWFDADRADLGLRVAGGLHADIWTVEARLAACAEHGHAPEDPCAACVPLLREAVDCYRGSFLLGISLADAALFEEWQAGRASRWHERQADLLCRLIRWHAGQAADEPVIAYARRWLALDPAQELAHRILIEIYDRTGQRTAALRQSALCVAALARELGVEPSPDTAHLIRAVAAGKRRHAAGTDPLTAPVALLPAPTPTGAWAGEQLTPLIGREAELAEIGACLRDNPGGRLLTIGGPGGIGKTRLAQAAAARLRPAFPDGVFTVPLADVRPEARLVDAIARALPLTLTPGVDAAEQVSTYLRGRRALLLIDNAEHMVKGVAELATLLERAPLVRMLVTSRERLNLRGETLLRLGGLDVPAEDAGAAAAAAGAVQLFVERAGRLRPDLRPDEPTLSAAARICRLVGGMPLAIELAAAWSDVLSPPAIAEEIARGLDFLSDGPRDAPDRHQSLRAVFEHSWRRLDPEEQAAMRALSVFRGGFERTAAATVAGADLTVLRRLVEASLLARRDDDRWEMHPVVRHYAADELVRAGEQAPIAERHATYFAQLCGERAAQLRGEGQLAAVAAISAEIESVRAAWQWAVEQKQAALIETAMEGLFRFYQMRSWLGEAAAAFRAAQRALSLDEAVADPALIARLAVRQAWFEFSLGEVEAARSSIARALPVLRADGALVEVAFALRTSGELARAGADFATARRHLEESRTVCGVAGDTWGLANAANALGVTEMTLGEYQTAASWYRISLDEYRRAGDRRGVTQALTNLGNIAYLTGSFEEARSRYEECLTVFEGLDDARGVALICNNLGVLASARGDFRESRRRHERSVAIKRALGDRPALALALNNLGAALRELGDYQPAEALLGEARSLAETLEEWAVASRACSDLGLIAGARAERGRARAAHRDALRYARDSGQTPIMLDALLWAADWLTGEDLRAAREVARLVLRHPAAHEALRKGAEQLLDQIARDRGAVIDEVSSEDRSVAEAVAVMLHRLTPADAAGERDAGVRLAGR